jgi:sulfoxide reductase heme-binding subunit YedZ
MATEEGRQRARGRRWSDGTSAADAAGQSTPGRQRRRHAIVALVALALTYIFWMSRPEWSPMHAGNRALADASLVLLAVTLAIGPLTRIWAPAAWLLPWRRETGIWTVVYGVAHTIVILDGWVEWDLVRLFGFLRHPQADEYVMVLHGFGLGNVLGLIALAYGIVLAATSNDRAQRFLGGRAWKFLQQGAYTLWLLVVAHTGYFLYLNFLDFHRPVPEPNWLQVPFAGLLVLIGGLQGWAFWITWRRRSRPATS